MGGVFVVSGGEVEEGRTFRGIYKALGCSFFFVSLFFIILSTPPGFLFLN